MSQRLSGIVLFPYGQSVMQVKVTRAWIDHAEEHAEARRDLRGIIKVSTWDIASRIADLAFLSVMSSRRMLTEIPDLPIGGYTGAINLVTGDKVSINAAATNEQFNFGAKAALRPRAKFVKKSSIHVLALYDPPYVDFLGWAKTSQVKDYPIVRECHKVPASDLSHMKILLSGVF